ncbi:hypothetical protein GW17_00038051 [Ensete ventricosum]|nr:hypothetical protein GW17_00038051 [Ensete ventricosum]RZS06314.1 hypothetical protein BHM03_00036952 [Ensete ventricosum]
MRLNYVESFYAFLLHFRSEGTKGNPLRPRPSGGGVQPLTKGVCATHGQAVRGSCPWPACKVRLPAANPQGAVACSQPCRQQGWYYHLAT